MAPALTLGLLPTVIALITGGFGLLIFGLFFINAASGDFVIIDQIRKENLDDLVEDHPSKAGYYIYRSIE